MPCGFYFFSLKHVLSSSFPELNVLNLWLILGLQPRDKAAMLGVKTKEYFPEEFT